MLWFLFAPPLPAPPNLNHPRFNQSGQPTGARSLNTANDKHMKTQVKVNDTRYPRLTRAVLRRVSRESLEDVVNHGASGGFSGFTYYTDTLAFYKAHKGDILALAEGMAEEFGQDMIEMISSFGCLKNDGLGQSEIAEALYSGRGDCATTIRNAMAWFALEEVARELNPDI